MTHPEPELLLQFAEGRPMTAEAAAHLEVCVDCRTQLAELGRFEQHLAAAAALDPGERARLRATTARVLATAQRRASFRRLAGLTVVALAAALLATVVLWPRGGGLGAIGVRRYEPEQVVRAGKLERYSLTVECGAPRWLALWQLDGPSGKRLVPHADPLLKYLGAEMPLPAGVHRVPATDVLDFEFDTAAPPTGLLLVVHATELADAELVAIERLVKETPRDRLLALVQAKWPEARLLAFPAR